MYYARIMTIDPMLLLCILCFVLGVGLGVVITV
jgi:hypothetical protein